ncbi:MULTISPECIES: nitrite reductase small subunit NirD [Prauserella salsuginis group]|uniref:Nitrite reductase (NADH) small subunit n=2 Tax=Prauserella salsuginis group TaxID=2893672 RepID=A0A839XEX1_9PSEU|nr:MULTISPECIES: nitrite reductase small subunit NirD [Prauserella salsuginis group]MBB3661820.1 nitrite reductase (NADH) small subunit [Prauserella sediminis]MCR3722803.1 nitrite reductase (NADH) small subunit [Prauserella flava]MCR3737142.1 nitrite reductase (NADH) small subunit [Prauserella salsuginis]
MTVLSEKRSAGAEVWTPVCRAEQVPRAAGVAVLLDDGVQVAVFRTVEGDVFGLSNVDPFSGAAVLSRGIVGDVGGVPVVASPVYKQNFDLRTGQCLDDAGVRIEAYPLRVTDGIVHVGVR